MATKAKKPSRLRLAILEIGGDMYAGGTLDDATYRKITRRDFPAAEAAPAAPMTTTKPGC